MLKGEKTVFKHFHLKSNRFSLHFNYAHHEGLPHEIPKMSNTTHIRE